MNIIITNNHKDLNYGQTVDIMDFNFITNNRQQVIVRPHGGNENYYIDRKGVILDGELYNLKDSNLAYNNKQ